MAIMLEANRQWKSRSFILVFFAFLLCMNPATEHRLAAQNSQNSKKAAEKETEKKSKTQFEVLEAVVNAHGKRLLSQTVMVSEGTVTIYTDKRSTVLGVTILRNDALQSQRILLRQADGRLWDGKGEHLSPEGQRALEFLDMQYTRGLRQVHLMSSLDAKSAGDRILATAQSLALKDLEGETTRYLLDPATARITQFDFERGQYRGQNDGWKPTAHSYAFIDYRTSDGIPTPFHVEHSANGIKQEELQLTKVRYLASPVSTNNK